MQSPRLHKLAQSTTIGQRYTNDLGGTTPTPIENYLAACNNKPNIAAREAEWEYAALGSYKDNENWNGYGDSTNSNAVVFAGYNGTNTSSIGTYAWYDSNAHEVKGKLPNSYGYDLSDNVTEYCYDWYGAYAKSDATGPTGGASSHECHIVRGNLWSHAVTDRSTCCYPYGHYNDMGFRLVRSSN